MTDKFGKFAGIAIERAVDGGALVFGAVAAGTGGVIVASVLVGTACSWLRAKAEGNDEAWQAARLSAVEDECRKLDERVKTLEVERAEQGLPFEPPDVLRSEAVYSEFAQAVAQTKTPEKRMALVNAAAHQFDPAIGSPQTRDFWFSRVRELSDVYVGAVMLLANRQLHFNEDAVFEVEEGVSHVLLGFSSSDAIAFCTALGMLVSAEPRDLRFVRTPGRSRVVYRETEGSAQCYELTQAGRVLLKFISD